MLSGGVFTRWPINSRFVQQLVGGQSDGLTFLPSVGQILRKLPRPRRVKVSRTLQRTLQMHIAYYKEYSIILNHEIII